MDEYPYNAVMVFVNSKIQCKTMDLLAVYQKTAI
jgi:hypothetical protein